MMISPSKRERKKACNFPLGFTTRTLPRQGRWTLCEMSADFLLILVIRSNTGLCDFVEHALSAPLGYLSSPRHLKHLQELYLVTHDIG